MMSIGRNSYEPKPVEQLDDFDVFTGFKTEISYRYIHGEVKPALLVEPVNKVMNTKSVLSLMRESNMRNRDIENLLIGNGVYTTYNFRTYIIESVEFDKDPSFEIEVRGEPKKIYEYYADMGHKISDLRQPLLRAYVNYFI